MSDDPDVLSLPPSTDFEVVTLGERRFTRHKASGALVMDLARWPATVPESMLLFWSSVRWARERKRAVEDFGG